jgi:hypothetical protein
MCFEEQEFVVRIDSPFSYIPDFWPQRKVGGWVRAKPEAERTLLTCSTRQMECHANKLHIWTARASSWRIRTLVPTSIVVSDSPFQCFDIFTRPSKVFSLLRLHG